MPTSPLHIGQPLPSPLSDTGDQPLARRPYTVRILYTTHPQGSLRHHRIQPPDHYSTSTTNIPISTAAPTHYVSFSAHTFLHFSNKNFFKNFGPFLRLQGLLPSIFEFPFSHCMSPYFSHFLLQGSLVHLHPGLVVILLGSNKDGDSWRHTTPSWCNTPSTELHGGT